MNIKISRRYVIVVFLFGLLGMASWNCGWTTTSDAVHFAGNLMQNHSLLLTPSDRIALDGIHRDLLEADDQLETAKDTTARERATQQRTDATGRLLALLERCTAAYRVSAKANQLGPSLSGPFVLSSDEGGLLFRVENGADDIQFASHEVDGTQMEFGAAVDIAYAPHGVTWILLGLYDLPVAQTALPLVLSADGVAPIRTMMTVVTPPVGRVRIVALDDDVGAPTPVMMRITSKATGRDRPPSNAVDLGSVFEGNGDSQGRRDSMMFGQPGGKWWVVPAPLDMALPAGDYDIALRRGLEHAPIFDHFTVPENGYVERTYRPHRWVDMRKRGWYSGDAHVHGRLLNNTDAERLMAWIRAEDVHVACILKYGDTYRTYLEQRGWGQASQVVDGDYLLSPGQEDPRTDELGHTISLNTTGFVRDVSRYYLYDWVADNVHAQGGLFGYAHVRENAHHVDRGMSINVPKGQVDFVEILQFGSLGTGFWYDFLNTGFRLAASAGSDVPWGGTVGEVRMYAYLGNEPFSPDAWFSALHQGRTFVTNGPMLEFQVDGALSGDEIEVPERSHVLHVKARAWGDPERSFPTKLTIVRQGETLREAVSSGPELEGLSLDFTIPAGNGFWIAARAEGNDGSVAHTTPIYVTRPGLRFWKYEQVEELLQKRLASLSEVESFVTKVRNAQKMGQVEGALWLNDLPSEHRTIFDKLKITQPKLFRDFELYAGYSLNQLAQQAPELLKRVEDAKKLYQNLRRVAEREKHLRSQE